MTEYHLSHAGTLPLCHSPCHSARRLGLGMWRSALVRTSIGFTSLAIGVCCPLTLRAQSQAFNGTLALSSQLVDRGLAVTPATPILQGAASWTSSGGWSLGLSGSTEVRSPNHLAEAFAQASRSWLLSPDWQMQASLVYYDYPNNAQSKVFDRTETGLNWRYRDVLTLGLSAIYPIGAKEHEPRGALDIDFHWPLPRHFSLSAGAGFAQSVAAPYNPYDYENRHANSYGYSRVASYGYGHAGLGWSRGSWRVELDRIATSSDVRRQGGELSTSPWVATLSLSF